jgi:hypothetical protein
MPVVNFSAGQDRTLDQDRKMESSIPSMEDLSTSDIGAAIDELALHQGLTGARIVRFRREALSQIRRLWPRGVEDQRSLP